MSELSIEHWGLGYKGPASYNDKIMSGRMQDAIAKLVCVGNLEAEQRVSAAITDQIAGESGVTQEQAEYLAHLLYRCLHSAFVRKAGRNGKSAGLPEVAVGVVFAAIDYLEEGLPNNRTMIAYRNRHNDFLRALGDLGEKLYGERQYNDAFYTYLGRKISQFALGNGLVDTEEVCALGKIYPAIEQAVAEQIIYFIGCGAEGPIKIGIAAKPRDRLNGLQTGHHETLYLLATAAGGRAGELEYHQRFKSAHLRGEWFSRHPDILAEIERLNQSTPRPTAAHDEGGVRHG
ncbi:hypothetical protein CJD35_13775 [Sphingobium xenophagum]|uniref:Bacteriophage T5 Orf172 DNA-binding domain-containing protein n=1 Tax=Sphingobium xenophagum TaxID=121428 RepID=A0A249MW40_SPHXE|nr:GIY-YIG nuclease family protein [Sphingobium xenophagum]ASY45384.1 hypothetical protein CJD35_13775 [Sphingobium xenophagum]